MKMGRPHAVPLSRQAIAIVREIEHDAEYSNFLFPSLRALDRPMCDNTINAALRRLGYSPPAIFADSKHEIVRVARPGARLAHRNLLAPRRLADDSRFSVDADLSETLRAADRGFIYSRFEAARVA